MNNGEVMAKALDAETFLYTSYEWFMLICSKSKRANLFLRYTDLHSILVINMSESVRKVWQLLWLLRCFSLFPVTKVGEEEAKVDWFGSLQLILLQKHLLGQSFLMKKKKLLHEFLTSKIISKATKKQKV